MTNSPMINPRFFAPRSAAFFQPRYSLYPRMYYTPSYSNSSYGSYPMPYSSDYGSSQMLYGSNYGSGYGNYSSPSYSGLKGEVNVGVYDSYFQPNQIVVSVGTTVRWTNSGGGRHTVTSDTGLWGSDELNPGEGYAHTFTTTGAFAYHCNVHPEMMRGVVIVR
jgi:plastocyanin